MNKETGENHNELGLTPEDSEELAKMLDMFDTYRKAEEKLIEAFKNTSPKFREIFIDSLKNDIDLTDPDIDPYNLYKRIIERYDSGEFEGD